MEAPSAQQLALWEACRFQKLEDATKALEDGANVNCRPGRDCQTFFCGAAYVKDALSDACASSTDSLDLVKYLISKGAEVDDFVIQHAVTRGAPIEAVKLLFEIRCKNEDEKEVAQEALRAWGISDFHSFSYPILEFLLSLKVDPDEWQVPITYCAQNNLLPHIELLLSYGANINKPQESSGNTALHLAVQHRHLQIIYVLLQKGADTSIKNNAGKTARELLRPKAEDDKDMRDIFAGDYSSCFKDDEMFKMQENEAQICSSIKYMLSYPNEVFAWYPKVVQFLKSEQMSSITSLTLSACPHSTKKDLLHLISSSCPSLTSLSLSLYEFMYPTFDPAEFPSLREFSLTMRRSSAHGGAGSDAPVAVRMPNLRVLSIQCWFYKGLMRWWGALSNPTESLERLTLCLKDRLLDVQIPFPKFPLLKRLEFEKVWNKNEHLEAVVSACPNLEELAIREATKEMIAALNLPIPPDYTDGKDSVTTWNLKNNRYTFSKKEPTPEIKPPPPSLANFKPKQRSSQAEGRGKKRKTAR